jgi:arsenite/tail-anchored protein-transporting ATPase
MPSEPDAYEDAVEDLDPSLATLLATNTLRWIFVGGKGGVGKTTTSCSIAVELASRRESVLLLSTDPAHNISDALCQKFSNKPTLVNGFTNLYAMEIDASLNESQEFKLKKDEGFGKVIKELMSAFPGVDEAMGFAELMQSVQSMPYSVIVFDTAPTGHTLRLLGFPQLIEKGLSKFGSLQSSFGGIMQMVQSMAGDQQVQEEELQQKVAGLRSASTGVREMFQDPTRCTFVCVCIPEFLSVYETERLIQELCKHGIDSSNIVVNQVLFPEDCGEIEEPASASASSTISERKATADLEVLMTKLRSLPVQQDLISELVALGEQASRRVQQLEKGWSMCQKKRKMQSKYLSQIADLYGDDFHVVAVPMLGDEVRGLDRLQQFAEMLRSGNRVLPLNNKR